MALSLYTAGHSTYEPLSAQPVGAPRDAELRNVLLAVMRWDRALCLVEEMKEVWHLWHHQPVEGLRSQHQGLFWVMKRVPKLEQVFCL